MSVFVDTGVFYAHQNESANRHERAKEILTEVLRGEYGQPYTSDYVYDETVTLVLSRTNDFEEARTVGERIRDGPVSILFVDESVFGDAVDAFERYADHGLSFTDATTVALMERHDTDTLLSFDSDFDGVVERISE